MKTLSVFNNSPAQGLFRLELENKKQVKEGGYISLQPEEKPQYDMTEMLVYSPRQISLEPQGKQAIRLSLRRPAELPDGEYRTYARLTRVSKEATERDAGIVAPSKAKAVVGINVGFAVPVILRKGKYDTTARIVDPALIPANLKDKDPAPMVTFKVTRTGKYSALGRVQVLWTPAGGEERQVGLLNGVNIFPELAERDVKIKLQDKSVSGGQLRLVYSGTDADKGIVFDEKVFTP